MNCWEIIKKILPSYPPCELIKNIKQIQSNDNYPILEILTSDGKTKVFPSKYSVEKETEKILKGHLEHIKNTDLIIVLGSANVYLVKRLLDISMAKVIVVETVKEIIEALWDQWEKLLENPSLKLLLTGNPKRIVKEIKQNKSKNPLLIIYPPQYSWLKDFFEPLKDSFYDFYHREQLNRNTIKRFGRIWLKNIIGNVDYLTSSNDIRDIGKIGFETALPCVIVAGGPSLNPQILEILKNYQNKMYVIAVDTSLPSLLKFNITPDILVSVDPQKENIRHIKFAEKYNSLKEIVLVSDVSNDRNTLALFNKRYLFMNPLRIANILLEENYSRMDTGGSVATTALVLSTNLNFNKIFFLGLDLSFSNNLYYSKLTKHYYKLLAQADILQPLELQNLKFTRNPMYTISSSVEDNYRVYIDIRFNIFKRWIEEFLKIRKRKIYRVIDTKVPKIENVEDITTQEFLDILKEIPYEKKKEKEEEIEGAKSFDKSTIELLRKLKLEGEKICKLWKSGKINEINELILNSKIKYVIELVDQEDIWNMLETQDSEKAKEYNRKLINNFCSYWDYLKYLIDKSIKRMGYL